MEEAVFDPTPSTEVQGEATGDDDDNGLDDDDDDDDNQYDDEDVRMIIREIQIMSTGKRLLYYHYLIP